MLRRRAVCLTASALTALTGTLVVPAGPPALAATVPAGFTDTEVESFNGPTTVEWLPGNQLVVLEKRGRVHTGPADGPFTQRLDLDVCDNRNERGLLGIAADPAYETNRFVYLYYTRWAESGCVNRLSRFTLPASGAIDPASEHVLLDNISSRNGNHNGGAVEFGRDGYLYVGIGDAGTDPRERPGQNAASQDLSLLNGKILRITTDGSAAPGNPLLGEPGVTACATRGNTPSTPTTPCAEIYSWGLRNPWRIAFDVYTGTGTTFYINDVGQGTYEEVNVGAAGNFGWPEREGPCERGDTVPCDPAPAGMIDPIAAYPRSVGQYITGGAFVPPGVWPAAYEGAYLFGDGGSSQIWKLNANGTVDYATPFADGTGGMRDMVFGYDAEGWATLYYVTGGALRAITPPHTGTLPPAPTPVPLPTPEPTPPLEPAPTGRLVYRALPPYRAFDSKDDAANANGRLTGGTPQTIDTNVPAGATAALVNLTIADTVAPGFLRVWKPGATPPETSTVNAETAGGYVANAAIVPVDDEGNFVVESLTDARVVVDVMGSFVPADDTEAAGRFVPLPSVRLADTREPAASDNAYTDNGTTTIVDVGRGGFPDGEVTGAYVLSIAAISQPGTPGGYVGAYPGGGEYTGTSNVNVTPGDVRANMVVVPADATGKVRIEHLNTAGIVVDVLGYFTGEAAPEASAGRFTFVTPTRSIDTRTPLGFARLGDAGTDSIGFVPPFPVAALVQNVTVTNTTRPGYLSTFPGDTPVDGVSTVNWIGGGQTRAALAFTEFSDTNRIGYHTLTSTDLVVDVVGVFTE